jgi:hypothetical protein
MGCPLNIYILSININTYTGLAKEGITQADIGAKSLCGIRLPEKTSMTDGQRQRAKTRQPQDSQPQDNDEATKRLPQDSQPHKTIATQPQAMTNTIRHTTSQN